MASFRGMDGSVTFATNVVGEVKSWSLDVQGEVLDDTAMGDKWRTVVGGLASWSGSLTANLDYGDTLGQKAMIDKLITATPASTSAAMELIASSTGPKKFTGSALITSVAIAAQMGSIISLQLGFTGNGALATSWV